MKDFLLGLLAAIIIAAIGFFGYKAITSTQSNTKDVQDEEVVYTAYENIFTTSMDAVQYRRHLFIEHMYDSVFISMSPEIVEQVAYVLLEKDGQTTQEDIVDEYLSNFTVYDALAKKRRCEEKELQDTLPPVKTIDSINNKL